ncbi:hypothetical protein ACMFMF_000517 [Clarireedia jacksonii]
MGNKYLSRHSFIPRQPDDVQEDIQQTNQPMNIQPTYSRADARSGPQNTVRENAGKEWPQPPSYNPLNTPECTFDVCILDVKGVATPTLPPQTPLNPTTLPLQNPPQLPLQTPPTQPAT